MRVLAYSISMLCFICFSSYASDAIRLSQYNIVKHKIFSGTDIEIEYDINANERFVIEIQGPEAEYAITKKEKSFGIWSKSKFFHTNAVPSFHLIATNLAKAELINLIPELLSNFYSKPLLLQKKIASMDKDYADAIQKFYEIQSKNGSNIFLQIDRTETEDDNINEEEKALNQVEKRKIKFRIPAIALPGEYITHLYVLDNNKQIQRIESAVFYVSKDDLYDFLLYIIKSHPLLYCLLTLGITIGASFFIHLPFQLIRKNSAQAAQRKDKQLEQ